MYERLKKAILFRSAFLFRHSLAVNQADMQAEWERDREEVSSPTVDVRSRIMARSNSANAPQSASSCARPAWWYDRLGDRSEAGAGVADALHDVEHVVRALHQVIDLRRGCARADDRDRPALQSDAAETARFIAV
jgi:hypothetical protein